MNEQPIPADCGTAAPSSAPALKRALGPLYLGGGIGFFVIVCILLLALLFGAANAFGESLNPISAIEMIMSIFHFRSLLAYRYVLSLIAGILYFVLLIFMIVKLATAAKKLSALFSKVPYRACECYKNMFEDAMNVFMCLLIFSVLMCSVTGSSLSGFMIFLMVLCGCSACYYEIFSDPQAQKPFPKALIDGSTIALEYSIFGVIAGLCCLPFGEQAVDGIDMMIEGLYPKSNLAFTLWLYTEFLSQVLDFILVVLLFFTMYGYFNDHHNGYLVKPIKSRMIMTGILMVCRFIAVVVLSAGVRYFTWEMLSEFFISVREFELPVFLLLTALLVLEKIARKNKYAS